MDLSAAIDCFTLGYAAGRSQTHPCLVRRVAPLWVVEDAPRKNPKLYRKREFVVLADAAPDRVVKLIASVGPGRYALCVIHPGPGRDAEVEDAYKSRGYRYMTHEKFFVRALPPVPRVADTGRIAVKRITDLDDAQRVNKAARCRQIPDEQFDAEDPDAVLFAALEHPASKCTPVGWVGSVRTDPTTAWVQNLHVLASHRRRGLGRALMKRMLQHDARRGITHSVLLASAAGALLYPQVGYEQLGTLQLFTPRR